MTLPAMTDESIEIVAASEATPGLREELRAWFESEFGKADRWASPDYYVLLRLDGRLAGRIGVHDTKVRVKDVVIRVGGIGGVATRPEFRRRGVASAMLSRAAEFTRSALKLDFGLLLCRHEMSPVYAKLGWLIAPGPTTFTRAGVTAAYPNDTMILPLADKQWPLGAIDMLGLPW